MNKRGQLVASCFGCCGKVNMDVVNYVQWRDSVDFETAIQILGEEAGISPERQKPQVDTHTILSDIMSIARGQLQSSESAMKYLTETRGLSMDVVKQAKLGYVANGYALIKQMKERGYTWADLDSVGFIATGTHRCRFPGRILFPIWSQGTIQALAGRQVANDGKYVRYLYTETTVPPLYTLTIIGENKPLLLVEGLMDLLSARSIGSAQSAALVSASFANHADIDRLVSQFKSVFYLLHEDEAGQKALSTLMERFPDKIIPVHLPLGFEDLNDALVQGKDKDWLTDILKRAALEHRSSIRHAS